MKNIVTLISLLFFLLSCTPLTKQLNGSSSRTNLRLPKKDELKYKTTILPKYTPFVSQKGDTTYFLGHDKSSKMPLIELDEISIISKMRSTPERAGKIKIDFVVSVPEQLINSKWQLRVTPQLDKNGKKIDFEKLLISGAAFIKQQRYGYRMYENFLASIIPDSAYMQKFFDQVGYQKALSNIEEQFYQAWVKNLLSESRFVDWHERQISRNSFFNGKMERNRSSISSKSWKSFLPSFWLNREVRVTGEWQTYANSFSSLSKRNITKTDSIEIAKRCFSYKRMFENEKKKALINEKYNNYVKFPRLSCRLDTIIKSSNGNFEYYYSQDIDADENIKKLYLSLSSEVLALDSSRYVVPRSDTLTYTVSSMTQFVDTTPKYKIKIISRHARKDITAYIQYAAGSSKFELNNSNNREEIEKVYNTLNDLTKSGELVIDSVNMISTSSPEGDYAKNYWLSQQRAEELKKYLLKRYSAQASNIFLFKEHPKGVDSKLLSSLLKKDSIITLSRNIIDKLSLSKDIDKELKTTAYYTYIKENIYPKLRAVNFNFYLHRKEMVKDTIHTMEIDTNYLSGIELLNNRKYEVAYSILKEYSDVNTAICLMSLNRNHAALEILESLVPDANIDYLKSILYARVNREKEAISSFEQACKLDAYKWYRGQLDPEINKLIINYNLNYGN